MNNLETSLQKPLLSDKTHSTRFKSTPNISENCVNESSVSDHRSFSQRLRKRRITSPPPPPPPEGDSGDSNDMVGGGRSPFSRSVKGHYRYSSPSEKESVVRRSLEEISKDIKEIEQFLDATENLMRNEKLQEKELRILRNLKNTKARWDKENKAPNAVKPTIQFKVAAKSNGTVSYKIGYAGQMNRRFKPMSPRVLNSRLYFRNGKIGCLEADSQVSNLSNVNATHALVKYILQYENEKPYALVSPDSVRRVLGGRQSTSKSKLTDSLEDIDEMPLMRQNSDTIEKVTAVPSEIETKVKPKKKFSFDVGAENKSWRFTRENQRTADHDEEDDDDNVFEQAEDYDDDDDDMSGGADADARDVQICYDELPEIQNEEKNLGPDEIMNTNQVMSSEMVAVDQMPLPTQNNESNFDEEGQQFLRNQVRHLVRRFTARANRVKSRLELPPTPSSTASSPSPPPQSAGSTANQLKPPGQIEKSSRSPFLSLSAKRSPLKGKFNGQSKFVADTPGTKLFWRSNFCGNNNAERTLDPQGRIYISWLCVVSFAFLYNAWVIPMRSTFPFQTKENTNAWLVADFCADIIYLFDVCFFKHRIMYLFEGFWVKNAKLTRDNYMRKLQFKLDILSLLPLDLLYLYFGTGAVYLRFPRLFKIQSFWEVFKLLDRVISSPHFVRVGKTLTYMIYMIHLTACAYYAYSDYQGLGVNRWVFSGKGHPYVRCFAFATKTATSIGKNPKPEREGEYVFMTAAWLMGVFVFALLIGQIRDIISTATRNKNEYRQLEDETLEYMRRLNLPKDVQRRVKMWFKFTWDQQRTLDEANILDSLPINLKTDIAISVHIQTLSKVQLFADCEEALLRDLVLKLRAVTFLPGDYVCRKGEVGREMYIIKLGQVQVMGGPNSDVVLATLFEGSVFGEISLLGINGADRRTADVRSKGYANLFVLSKADLNEVIAYYPNAQAILKKRARTLMRKNAAREREEARARNEIKADVVIGNPKTPETPPKLLQTVIQVLPYESPAVVLITRGSKRLQRNKRQIAEHDSSEQQQCTMKSARERESIKQQKFDYDNNKSQRRSNSPDLLSSIQDELKTKHKFINLTDSEKALIISGSTSSGALENDKDDEKKTLGKVSVV